MPYAGKSLMIHIKAALNGKIFFLYTSYVSTPTYHKFFNSSIKGLTKTSSFFPGFFGPGIIIIKNMNGLVMHFHEGKL